MKIAIIGYGNMGRIVERLALEQGHTVTAIVDPLSFEQNPFSGAPLYRGMAEAGNLLGAEVAFEFTKPAMALANIKFLAEKKIPMVIGTTGWYDKLDEARQEVEQAETALIWATNFSLGVNMFYRIAWYAARLANPFPEYDVGGYETHHNKKLDSPSGTAKTLVNGVLKQMSRKDSAVYEPMSERRPLPNEIHFSSLRLGSVPGTHSIFFDSPADSIEITHTARNREGLAAGAIRAAGWLISPGPQGKRKGIYTIDDMLGEMLG